MNFKKLCSNGFGIFVLFALIAHQGHAENCPYSDSPGKYIPRNEGAALIESLKQLHSTALNSEIKVHFVKFEEPRKIEFGGKSMNVHLLQNWELNSTVSRGIAEVNAVKFKTSVNGKDGSTYCYYDLEVTSDFRSNEGSFRIETIFNIPLDVAM